MTRHLLKLKRGFTLVELMIVVAIIGVLAALAIYGVNKYLNNAKTAEAREALGRLGKDASAAYNRENMSGDLLAAKGTSAISNRLCGSATATVPAAIASVQGKKYQSSPSEWSAGDQQTGWQCLKFSIPDPQYYMYTYTSPSPTSTTASFTAIANGDLNGDTTTSTFTLLGGLLTDNGQIVMRLAPTITEDKPDE